MEFNLSDFPVCKDLFDNGVDVEEDSRQGALTEDDCIVTGDAVPPSDFDDPNRHVLNPNFSCQISACQQSFATMADLKKHRVDTHVLAIFTIPLDSCNNNDDLKSGDQSCGTNEHETHISGDDSEKENIKENSIEENSDSSLSVHWKNDPAVYQMLAKPLSSDKISNCRVTPGVTPYWPDQLQSIRVVRRAYEMETENTDGRIEEGGHANRWSNAFLFSGALILVNLFLQKLSIKLAFCRCPVSVASLPSACNAARMRYHHAWHEGFPGALRGIGGDSSLLRQFLQTFQRAFQCVIPYIPATQAAQSIYVITAIAVIVLLVWKLIRFRRNPSWRIFLHPRPRAGPRRHGLNRTANPKERDHDQTGNGAGSGTDDED